MCVDCPKVHLLDVYPELWKAPGVERIFHCVNGRDPNAEKIAE